MEIRNNTTDMVMKPGLVKALAEVRKARNFNADIWIEAKCTLLNDYMRHFGLKACVIAVSGGIDSAVVLGLAAKAREMKGSPIEKIVPITIPCTGNKGVSGQEDSMNLAIKVSERFGYNYRWGTDKSTPLYLYDIDDISKYLTKDIENITGLRGNDWAQGQLVSYLRTPIIYYMTSLLAQNQTPAIVLGTTNLSEGGYLGYFGKASDGMVDVQMISDIYKSEVYKVAELLDVPKEIIERAPTGDMFDACPDEVVFGAPYDFVELYMEHIRDDKLNISYCDGNENIPGLEQYVEYAQNLERMHNYNKHKYLGKSPAVHLDIMDCTVPGGWDNRNPCLEPEAGMTSEKLHDIINQYRLARYSSSPELEDIDDLKQFNGPFQVNGYWPPRDYSSGKAELTKAPEPNFQNLAEGIDKVQLLNKEECSILLNDQGVIHWSKWRPADLFGKKMDVRLNVGYYDDKRGYHPELRTEIGSWRATTVSDSIANTLWSRLKPNMEEVYIFDDTSDVNGHYVWKPVGISNLLRFIMYRGEEPNNMLFPHYDAPFVYNSRKRTLKSLVVYLNKPWHEGGETRFIKDWQKDLYIQNRDLNDWGRVPNQDEVEMTIKCEPGEALMFNHRILHDASPISNNYGESKTIIRTDVIFERVDFYR